MGEYTLLVYLALFAVVTVLVIAARVIRVTTDDVDLETRKIRFAAATFTGILMLLLFVAVLYFVDPSKGKPIFDTVLAALSPLGGAVIGYLFGTRGKAK